MRTFLNFAVRTALIVLICAQVLYLARRPLCERWLCQKLASVASDALGARVTVGALGGDWVSYVRAEGVAIASDGVLRQVEGAELEVEVDPWRLLRRDLGGLLRARVRADRVAVDLRHRSTGGSSAAAPPDLVAIAGWFAKGVALTVATCTVQGQASELSGSAEAHLAPMQSGQRRRILVEAPLLRLECELSNQGVLDVTARTPRAARLARLFVPHVDVTGGRCEGHATLTLAPQLAGTARAQLRECVAHDQTITHLHASGRLDAHGIHDIDVQAAAPGTLAQARVRSLPFADGQSPDCDLRVALDDLAPWAALLSPDLRGRVPSGVRARAALSCQGATPPRADADVTVAVALDLADVDNGRLHVFGSLPWRADLDWRAMLRHGAELRAEVTDFDPSVWTDSASITSPRVSGTAHWRTRQRVDIGAEFEVRADRVADVAAPATAALRVRADDQAITITDLRAACGAAIVHGSARLGCSPIDLLAGGNASAVDTRADLTLATVSLADLCAWAGVVLPLDDLRGSVSGNARLCGTIAAPEVSATLTIADAALRTTGGERLDDVAATLEVTPRTVRIVNASASRGAGPLTLAGELTIASPWWEMREHAWPAAVLSLTLQGSNVLLHRRAGLKVRADLALVATGPLSAIAITGRVAVRDSKLVTRVPLFDLRRTGGVATTSGLRLPGFTLPEPLRARLDVDITTAEPFVAKTNVLEGSLSAQLELLGDLAAPRLLGTISGPDATVVLPGCRLKASALLLQFSAENPDVPTVTLNARGRRHGYDIRVNARGPYDRPDMEFSSDPALPPDELVVLVTTGARPAALRGTRGVGTVLGAYVAQEFADWAFGSESTEAKESFIDRFTIETGTEMSRGGNESIVVEFRVGDRLYLQGERDVYDDLNMGLVYRLRLR